MLYGRNFFIYCIPWQCDVLWTDCDFSAVQAHTVFDKLFFPNALCDRSQNNASSAVLAAAVRGWQPFWSVQNPEKSRGHIVVINERTLKKKNVSIASFMPRAVRERVEVSAFARVRCAGRLKPPLDTARSRLPFEWFVWKKTIDPYERENTTSSITSSYSDRVLNAKKRIIQLYALQQMLYKRFDCFENPLHRFTLYAYADKRVSRKTRRRPAGRAATPKTSSSVTNKLSTDILSRSRALIIRMWLGATYLLRFGAQKCCRENVFGLYSPKTSRHSSEKTFGTPRIPLSTVFVLCVFGCKRKNESQILFSKCPRSNGVEVYETHLGIRIINTYFSLSSSR